MDIKASFFFRSFGERSEDSVPGAHSDSECLFRRYQLSRKLEQNFFASLITDYRQINKLDPETFFFVKTGKLNGEIKSYLSIIRSTEGIELLLV